MMLLMLGEPRLDLFGELADGVSLKAMLVPKEDRTVLTAQVPAVVAGLEHLALEVVHVLNTLQIKALPS